MRLRKRLFGWSLPVLALFAVGMLAPDNACGAIVFTGDVTPSNTIDWNGAADCRVGLTGGTVVGSTSEGAVYVDSSSILTSGVAALGYGSNSKGTVTIDGAGSLWNVSTELKVGRLRNGTLNLLNGGAVVTPLTNIAATDSSYSSATVDGAGSMLNTDNLNVASGGFGSLNVTNGGTVYAITATIANNNGTQGTVTVGNGSTFNISSELSVGHAGKGILNLQSGSIFSVGLEGGGKAPATFVGNYDDSQSEINFSGGTFNTIAMYTRASSLKGTGTINTYGLVADGIDINFDSGSSKTVVLNGTGQNVTMNVDMGNASYRGPLGAGYWGEGTLTVSNGTVTSTSGLLGYASYGTTMSSGTATVTGPTAKWTCTGGMVVGVSGRGTLVVENGGTLQSVGGSIGDMPQSAGTVAVTSIATVTGPGSTWNMVSGHSGDLEMGESQQSGTLEVLNGGQVTNINAKIGKGMGTTAVTVDNASWTNTGDLYVGYKGSGTASVAINNGAYVSAAGSTYVGYNLAGGTTGVDGTLSFGGTGGTLDTESFYASPTQVTGSGGVINTIGLVADIDLTFDSSSSLTQNGLTFGGATLNLEMGTASGTYGALGVGYKGNGTLSIDNGMTVYSTLGALGYHVNSSGTATVTGGSTWMSGPLDVGVNGSGTLNIFGGTVNCGSKECVIAGYYGDPTSVPTTTGIVTVDGTDSLWTTTGTLKIGERGNAELNILNGAKVNNKACYIAYYNKVDTAAGSVTWESSGDVTVDGDGSTWTNSSNLYIGYKGAGTLDITNGGLVKAEAGTTYVGYGDDATGTVSFGGTGGTLSTKGLYASASQLAGTGTVVTKGLVSDVDITFDSAASLTQTLTGAGSYGDVAVQLQMDVPTNNTDLGVGNGSNASSLTITTPVTSKVGYIGYATNGTGTATVSDSGAWTCNAADMKIANGDNSLGTLAIQNGGAVSNKIGYVAYGAGAVATATVDGATWTNTDDLYVGYGAASDGTLFIQNGGSVNTADITYVGQPEGSNGAIQFNSGTLSTKSLYVAPSQLCGTGVVAANGLVSDVNLVFDSEASKAQTLAMAGSSVSVQLDMTSTYGNLGAGYVGNGTLAISNGITVNSGEGCLGYQGTATGTATVSDNATWAVTGKLIVGNEGVGTLNIQSGGTVSSSSFGLVAYDTEDSSGVVNVSGAGSTFAVGGTSGTLYLGYDGDGILNIENGGTVIVRTISGSQYADATGIVNFDGGTLKSPRANTTWIKKGQGLTGVIIKDGGATFDTQAFAMGIALPLEHGGSNAIDGGLTKIGTGSLTIAGYNTYTGLTNVLEGTLAYSASHAIYNGGVNIGGSATTGTLNLGAYEDVVGAVTLINGAISGTGKLTSTVGFIVENGSASAILDGNVGLTKTNSGTVVLTGANTYAGQTVVNDGVLELGDAAQAVVLSGAGADIQFGKMVFDYTGTAPSIGSLLETSFHDGAWDQGQFLSTTADGNHGLGWVDNGTDQISVMYTLYGDSNLDGSVNGTDLNAVLSYYNQSSEVWGHGDFNYDGSVNGTDLNTVLSNYNQSLSASTAAVPEPSTLLLLVLGLAGLLTARRVRACTHR